jgi:hypothetical protein
MNAEAILLGSFFDEILLVTSKSKLGLFRSAEEEGNDFLLDYLVVLELSYV